MSGGGQRKDTPVVDGSLNRSDCHMNTQSQLVLLKITNIEKVEPRGLNNNQPATWQHEEKRNAEKEERSILYLRRLYFTYLVSRSKYQMA